jgi:hypothetical protein
VLIGLARMLHLSSGFLEKEALFLFKVGHVLVLFIKEKEEKLTGKSDQRLASDGQFWSQNCASYINPH